MSHVEAVVDHNAPAVVSMSRASSALAQIGKLIFGIRWGLVPMYVGLGAAMIAYNYKFFLEIYEMFEHLRSLTENDLLLLVLGMIDITMVGNLVVMTTIGGYSIFVKEYDYTMLPDKPRWLSNINSSTQKIKMGMSLIGVAAIHLLKSFMDATNVSWDQLSKEGFIFLLFIFFTYALGVIDKQLHHAPALEEHH